MQKKQSAQKPSKGLTYTMTSADQKSQKRYQERIDKVKRSISKFDKNYFIEHCIDQISKIDRQEQHKFNYEPIWMLAIKISALTTGGRCKPSHRDIVKTINSLWDINNCIIPYLSSDSTPQIALRAMVNLQSTYQNDATSALASISRQLALLANKEELNKRFKEETGISISAYCWIWMHILSQLSNDNSGSFEINLIKLITDTKKCVSIRDIYKFFQNFSIHQDEMPSYFSKFTNYDYDFESYFYDSPLKQRPFILNGNSIRTISTNLTISSVSFLLPHIFKTSKNGNTAEIYKKIFTKEFETHIGNLLSNTIGIHKNEDDIRQLYRSLGMSGKRNNVVDHSITLPDSNKILLVESKGVEQTDYSKTILNEPTLTYRLKDSHLKGITQIQQCAKILTTSPDLKHMDFYAVIIVNDDYGFSSATQLQEMIGQTAFTSTTPLITVPSPISFDKIRFTTISTLEKIFSSIKDNEYSLDHFLEKSGEPEFRYNLDTLHHKLTKTHPGQAIHKFISIDSPYIKALTNLAISSENKSYSISQLVMDSKKILSSLHNHKKNSLLRPSN